LAPSYSQHRLSRPQTTKSKEPLSAFSTAQPEQKRVKFKKPAQKKNDPVTRYQTMKNEWTK
jgi:hypothetical protein